MKKGRMKLAYFFAAAASALAFVLSAFPARAADGGSAGNSGSSPYTYTVTIYSGEKGYFDAGETTVNVISSTIAAMNEASSSEESGWDLDDKNSKIVISGLSYGDRINVSFSNVLLYPAYEDAYSAVGVRLAGRDSSTAEALGKDMDLPSFEVMQDADYVIAYSMLTDPVTYTVKYLEKGSGKVLKDSQTGRADNGKTIIVGAEAVNGYVPETYNISLTLDKEEENEITFYYNAISHTTQTNTVTVTDTVTTTETQYVPGDVTEINSGGAGAAGTGGIDTAGMAGAAGAGGEGESADGAGGQTVSVLDNEEIPLGSGIEEPQELVDLDDGDTPLGLIDSLDEGGASRSLLFVYIAIALLGALGIFGIFFFLMRRKKEEESSSEEPGRG